MPPAYGMPPPGYGMPPQQSNGMAIAGLICAIVGFCVWYLGGLLGVIFGIIGLRKTRDPRIGGRGVAIASIIVGSLSLLWSIGFTVLFAIGGVAMFSASQKPRAVAREFVQYLDQGNTQAAMADATSDLSTEDLEKLSKKLQNLGTFNDMTSLVVNINETNGRGSCRLQGSATFTNGTAQYDITLVNHNGTWKVSDATFH